MPRTHAHKSIVPENKVQDHKFLPNIGQIQDALPELPDPETWDEDRYSVFIDVDGKRRSITFKKVRIARGSKKVHRWIYSGKMLVRQRDIESHSD